MIHRHQPLIKSRSATRLTTIFAAALGKNPQLFGEMKLATGQPEPSNPEPMPSGDSTIKINIGNQTSSPAPTEAPKPSGGK